jgi:molecular chaperone IbpA
MTRITSLDLNPFYRNSIGFNQLFDRITSNMEAASHQSYPPYNIIRKDDEHYFIEIAAAGFLKPDIAITMENGTLTVTGNQTKEDIDGLDEADGYEYLHRGLAGRNFTRTFNLADFVEVKDASLNNGILSIHLEKIIPEAMKPKTIKIK